MLLQEKCDKLIKGRCIYNGKPTQHWITYEDTSSLTMSLKSVILTAAVDTHEGQDVMTVDISNAFI